MARNFRELERQALADPKRRENIRRERARLDRAFRITKTGAAGAVDRN
jgi:hypothetical protein